MRRHRFGILKIPALLAPRHAWLRRSTGRLAVDIAGVDATAWEIIPIDRLATVVAYLWRMRRSTISFFVCFACQLTRYSRHGRWCR